MSDHLARTIAAYALLVGGAALVVAVTGRGVSRTLVAAVVALELASVAGAVIDGVGLLRGHAPAEPATHLGYLAASVLILPVALSAARPEGTGSARWDATIAAAGCLALAVVALRLRLTWAAHG